MAATWSFPSGLSNHSQSRPALVVRHTLLFMYSVMRAVSVSSKKKRPVGGESNLCFLMVGSSDLATAPPIASRAGSHKAFGIIMMAWVSEEDAGCGRKERCCLEQEALEL